MHIMSMYQHTIDLSWRVWCGASRKNNGFDPFWGKLLFFVPI